MRERLEALTEVIHDASTLRGNDDDGKQRIKSSQGRSTSIVVGLFLTTIRKSERARQLGTGLSGGIKSAVASPFI
jgi:hypothetical protein